MPTSTYIALANLTTTGNTALVTFSSISQSYKDLVLVIRGSGGGGNVSIRPNGTSGITNLIWMQGDGSSASGSNANGTDARGSFFNANATSIWNIMDYSATNKHKTMFQVGSTPGTNVSTYINRSETTSAITSLEIRLSNSDNYYSGTSFALYGIAA